MATALDTSTLYDGQNVFENDWRKAKYIGAPNGVGWGILNGFQCIGDSTGMHVKVNSGQCWVENAFGENASQKTLPLTSDPSQPRISLAIIRNVFGVTGPPAHGGHLELDILPGTPGASPVAPALTQNSAMWEMQIAAVLIAAGASTITAGNVNDQRMYYNRPSISQVLASSATLVGLSASAGTSVETQTATLPVGWLEMDVTHNISFAVAMTNAIPSYRAGSVWLEKGGVTQGLAIPYGYVPNATGSAFDKGSITYIDEGLTVSTAYNLKGTISSAGAANNDVGMSTRYWVVKKTRVR